MHLIIDIWKCKALKNIFNKKGKGPSMMEGFRKGTSGGKNQLEFEYNELGDALNHTAVQMNSLEGTLTSQRYQFQLKARTTCPMHWKKTLESILGNKMLSHAFSVLPFWFNNLLIHYEINLIIFIGYFL